VRGTTSEGRIGPDLTHVGSRLTLAAGTLPNGGGPLAAWIADPQHIKPGSRMPGYRRFTGEELRALSAYLEGLR
jgi:cytochrome c oxidase subunit II